MQHVQYRPQRFANRYATRLPENLPNGVHTEIEPQGVRDIEELVEVCKQQDIPLLLVYSPEYYEMQALERNRHEVFARVREISDQFTVPLWDYSDSSISRNRAYFYNSQHLNADGAKVFSTGLAPRLIETGMVRNP
jgi:hypothetical protein